MPVAPTKAKEESTRKLTEAEELEVLERIKHLKKLFAGDKSKATYKIEVRLMSKRSGWQPVAGIVSFWKSGNRLHGGGDEKIYLCPGHRRDSKSGDVVDCNTFLSDEERTLSSLSERGELKDLTGGIVCVNCGKVWPLEDLIGEKIYKLTPQNWAVALVRLFLLCKYDADIVLKYSSDDIRSIAVREQDKQLKGDLLTPMRNSRKKKGTAIYRLENIIKDTANGADLQGRFYSFITV